jgi:hypothetical protein
MCAHIYLIDRAFCSQHEVTESNGHIYKHKTSDFTRFLRLTHITNMLAIGGFVIQVLLPLSIYELPDFSAVDSMEPGS